ncbi:type II secretion system protein J [Chloroflexota bacterium]
MKQKGFTLVEVLVVLAIGSTIALGILLTFTQIVIGTGRSNSQIIALTDVTQAALAIQKDLQMTQTSNLIDGNPAPQDSILLEWTDYTAFASENATSHSSNYTLSGTILQRDYDGTVSIIGRHITGLGFTQDGSIINVTITSTGTETPPRSKTLEFIIQTRPEEIEE